MSFSFKETGTLAEFQKFIGDVYSVPDDRIYSVWDLLAQEERFTMRALKGIRKEDPEKLKLNLLISLSWLMSIGNRLHIDIESEMWKRFPGMCSYCGSSPCVCKETKPSSRLKMKGAAGARPRNLSEMQDMFGKIYPSQKRSLADAGVHLAEEAGEVSEAVHNYLGEHKESQFDEVKLEIADFVSCVFGVANSASFDVSKELGKMYGDNCHVCHKAPCVCSFSDVARIKT